EAEHYKDYVPEVIPEYFILGTVNNYMGRFYLKLKEDQLDYYWNNEDSTAYFLKKYLKDKFGVNIKVVKDELNRTITYSPELAKKINGYFDETGSLKTDTFKADEDICSFLLGVYYRYGYKITDFVYKIQGSSIPDSKIIYSLLNKVRCDKIIYSVEYGLLPVQTVFYFKSSVLLEKYFNSIEPEYVARKVEKPKLLSEEKEKAVLFLFK
ncbi:MAG: hypothetical protein LBH32_00470, partial [Dysgonamonadaceae bacterium]|nr:hypothetical protein [Dysgonamonadaceae bacterium]